jgi:hypothetical protein
LPVFGALCFIGERFGGVAMCDAGSFVDFIMGSPAYCVVSTRLRPV